jgi:sugar/nucleoside kinase (ribokinase family)
MSLLVTGSIGIDTVETPHGKRDNVIGGSAIYFSHAASFFSPVRLVGVVGEDFDRDLGDLFGNQPVDLAGLEKRPGSKTFRWHGSYVEDMNDAQTVEVDLNVLAEAAPKLPESYLDSQYVFLANTHPALQQDMLGRLKHAKLSVADTMNLWIQTERDNLIDAAHDVLKMGPKFVVIKKGEHGCLLASDRGLFVLPAYPTAQVIDPTGAGDSFAAGMMGYLASQGGGNPASVKRALAYGTVVASYTISDFSLDGLRGTDRAQIDDRYEHFKQSMSF